MSQTSTTLFSQSQSQSQSQPQSQGQKYGPTGRSQIHSAGCVRDGEVICACDKRAVRYISRTKLNPDRPFYRCANGQCKFWKWEDELLGTGLFPAQGHLQAQTQAHSQVPVGEPKTALKQEHNEPSLASASALSPITSKGPVTTSTAAPITIAGTNSNSNSHSNLNQNQDGFQLTTTPSQSALSPAGAKRSYARMSTGGTPPSKPGPLTRVSREMSEEDRAAAKARRDESIRLALLQHSQEEEDEEANADDEREVHQNLERARPDDGSDDEHSGPVTKKTRFADTVKVEEVDSARLSSGSQAQRQFQPQTQVPSTPPRRSNVSFNTQLPTPSQTSMRKSTANTGADIEVDDIYEAEGPPSPTSFTKAGQRAEERERARVLDPTIPPLNLSLALDKGKAPDREDRSIPVNVNGDEGAPPPNNAHTATQINHPSRLGGSDPGPSSQRISQEKQARHEHAHAHMRTHKREHDDNEERLHFAIQLGSAYTGTNANIRTPTPTRVTHSTTITSGQTQPNNNNENVVSQSSTEKPPNATGHPAPSQPQPQPQFQSQPTQPTQLSSQTLTQQSLFPSLSFPSSPSSHLKSLVSEMGAQQTAMQAALSLMAVQQTTLEMALHEYMSESEKSKRKARALEKSVTCKDKEIARLRALLEELRKRNAELEAFQVRFEQFKRTAPGPSQPK